MIVFDTNLFAYAILGGPNQTMAQGILKSVEDWIAPPIVCSEFLNVLVSHCRFKQLDVDAGIAQWRFARQLFNRRLVEPDMEATLRLASSAEIAAYDAQFVQLAVAHGTKLVSDDKNLRMKTRETTLSLAEYYNERHNEQN